MAADLFPRMFGVRQHFPKSPPVDIRATLQQEFAKIRSQLEPGANIAVAVGSRGITNLQSIVASVVDLLKSAGAKPFIVPAMGSHGGATPEGQKEILAEYGITEARLDVPIQAAMEVERLGATEDGVDVFFSEATLRSDGVVVINRVKPHTDFSSDSLGSGVLKMLVVGLGKRIGAANFHLSAARFGYEHVLRSIARVTMRSAPVLCGVAIVENQFHETAVLKVLLPEEFEEREGELFREAKRLMPQLPFDDVDLLIVDRLGKNISGAGMDPNITGRWVHGYSSMLGSQNQAFGGVWPSSATASSALSTVVEGSAANSIPSVSAPGDGRTPLSTPNQAGPTVRRLFVRDLTPETHGNAIGVGLADLTTSRLVQGMDKQVTYINALTSLSPNCAKIPIYFDTDREAITRALASLPVADPRQAKIIRIHDTLSLEKLEVSEAYTEALKRRPELEAITEPQEMRFGPADNLAEMS